MDWIQDVLGTLARQRDRIAELARGCQAAVIRLRCLVGQDGYVLTVPDYVAFTTPDGLCLSGALALPDGARQAAVLVHGSGVTREEGGFFTGLAAGLVRQTPKP